MASLLASRSCVSRAVRVNVARPQTCQPKRLRVVVRSEGQTQAATDGPSAELTADVISIIASQLAVEPSTITPESKFVDLGADSLDTVEIMMALEEKFDITLNEEGAEKIAVVADAAKLIHETVKTK